MEKLQRYFPTVTSALKAPDPKTEEAVAELELKLNEAAASKSQFSQKGSGVSLNFAPRLGSQASLSANSMARKLPAVELEATEAGVVPEPGLIV